MNNKTYVNYFKWLHFENTAHKTKKVKSHMQSQINNANITSLTKKEIDFFKNPLYKQQALNVENLCYYPVKYLYKVSQKAGLFRLLSIFQCCNKVENII